MVINTLQKFTQRVQLIFLFLDFYIFLNYILLNTVKNAKFYFMNTSVIVSQFQVAKYCMSLLYEYLTNTVKMQSTVSHGLQHILVFFFRKLSYESNLNNLHKMKHSRMKYFSTACCFLLAFRETQLENKQFFMIDQIRH